MAAPRSAGQPAQSSAGQPAQSPAGHPAPTLEVPAECREVWEKMRASTRTKITQRIIRGLTTGLIDIWWCSATSWTLLSIMSQIHTRAKYCVTFFGNAQYSRLTPKGNIGKTFSE
eukprot:4616190-Pyramimonas_sp.AAC.1